MAAHFRHASTTVLRFAPCDASPAYTGPHSNSHCVPKEPVFCCESRPGWADMSLIPCPSRCNLQAAIEQNSSNEMSPLWSRSTRSSSCPATRPRPVSVCGTGQKDIDIAVFGAQHSRSGPAQSDGQPGIGTGRQTGTGQAACARSVSRQQHSTRCMPLLW